MVDWMLLAIPLAMVPGLLVEGRKVEQRFYIARTGGRNETFLLRETIRKGDSFTSHCSFFFCVSFVECVFDSPISCMWIDIGSCL